MKKSNILFLGASYSQIPLIKEAKNRGFYVITSDNLADNPGHKLSDENHNISTTDYEGILSLADKVKADLVIAYASDPAALIAAYVSEKLGLPGNSYKSVQILSEKDLFRQFMKEFGFNVPQVVNISSSENLIEKLKDLSFPFIVKPTDASGSKGVSKVENIEQLENAANIAFEFSRNNRIIAEEFIDNTNADLHGDGFVVDGELVFSFLGDHIYNIKSNPFNPIGTLWPSSKSPEIIKKVESDVARLIKLSGFKNGPINIEVRVNSDGNIYIMEIGPRSGGHFVPQAIKYATDFDMVKAILDVYLNKKVNIFKFNYRFSAYYAIHSDIEGILERLEIKDELLLYVKELHIYKNIGEPIMSFRDSGSAIGIILMTFDTRQEMDYYLSNIDEFIVLIIG